MNNKYKVGQLRPSQILFTYGIGAVADLLNFSVIIMGLDEWDNARIKLHEERLLAEVRKKLEDKNIKKLLLPPIDNNNEDNNNSPWDETSLIGIPVAPFPSWMVCPITYHLNPYISTLLDYYL